MGILAGLLSMLGWGVSDFLGAKFSRKFGYFLPLFWIQATGFLIALVYFLFNFSLTGEVVKFLPIFVICGLLNAVGYLAFFKGLKNSQVSLVSPLGSCWTLVTIILSLIFFREVLSISQALAIFLLAIGIILASMDIRELFKGKKVVIFSGVKEGLIAMLSWGVVLFLIVFPSRSLGWFLPVFIFRFFTILFLTLFIFINKQSITANLSPKFLLLFLGNGILEIGAFFAYTFGINNANVSIVAAVAASFPILTIILARVFLKEKLALNQTIGVISVIAGLVLISIK